MTVDESNHLRVSDSHGIWHEATLDRPRDLPFLARDEAKTEFGLQAQIRTCGLCQQLFQFLDGNRGKNLVEKFVRFGYEWEIRA